MIDSGEIKATRERLGESQAQFGKRFGVDQSTVHRWENEGVPSRGPARIAIEQILPTLSPPASPSDEDTAQSAEVGS